MSHIFISYSHDDSDRKYAHKLEEALTQRGFEVWIDDRIDYGETWPQVIQEQVDACTALIVIMTPRSYSSRWVHNELARAQDKGKPVFPLLLEGDNWLAVQAIQHVDVRDGGLPADRFYVQLGGVIPQATGVLTAEERESVSTSRQTEARTLAGVPQEEFLRLYEILDKPDSDYPKEIPMPGLEWQHLLFTDGIDYATRTRNADLHTTFRKLLEDFGRQPIPAHFKLLFNVSAGTKAEEVTWLAKKIGTYAGVSLFVFDEEPRETFEVIDEVEHWKTTHHSDILQMEITGALLSLRNLVVCGALAVLPKRVTYYFDDDDSQPAYLTKAVDLAPESTQDFIQGYAKIDDAGCLQGQEGDFLVKIIRLPYWPNARVSEIVELRQTHSDALGVFRRNMDRLFREGNTVDSESRLIELLDEMDHSAEVLRETLREATAHQHKTGGVQAQMQLGVLMHLVSSKSRNKVLSAADRESRISDLNLHGMDLQRRLAEMGTCDFWLLLECAGINRK